MVYTAASLRLSTGVQFHGLSPTFQPLYASGEVVFNTGMVGYVESLTDPSYAGQILVFTYPLIGNYGVPSKDEWESQKIHAKGAIFSEAMPFYSHYTAKRSLEEWLASENIPYMIDVDTRALTLHLRHHGVLPGAICLNDTLPPDYGDFEHTNWVAVVSPTEVTQHGTGDCTVILVDFGAKENILRFLLECGVRVLRVPHDYDYTEENYDGIVLSNGPGDPTLCHKTIAILKKTFLKQKPIFGICLGTQLMALASGAKVYKLPFGHRSHNQPCMELATSRCFLTSQNHSYAIDENTLSDDWRVSFRNLNDQSVEGIAHKTLPFSSVQFHPEASAGPLDTQFLFKEFYALMLQHKNKR